MDTRSAVGLRRHFRQLRSGDFYRLTRGVGEETDIVEASQS
jgi:hypothetical protein